MSQMVIQVSNLTKFYGDFKALDAVSFSVEQGSVYGYLGPNGAGKTTTIRTMLGLLQPNEGEIRIDGTNPHEEPVKALQNVGYSPELPNLPSFLTGEQLLDFTGKMFAIPPQTRKEKIDRILELVGLEKARNKKIGNYSKGMVQRLSVGTALINDPAVLVLDEPTIGLDPEGTAHFRELFKRLVKEGKTIFVSSHLLEEVQKICTHVGMINEGSIVFDGPIEQMSEAFTRQWIVEAELEESTPEIIDALQHLDYVENIRVEGNTLLIELEEKKDRRSAVSSAIFEHGGKIVSLNLRKASLEDAYLRALQRGDEQ